MIITKKNKLIQMILAGLVLALIMGVLSYVLKPAIIYEETKNEKQIVIIDLNYNNNEINSFLNKNDSNLVLNEYRKSIQQLFDSIKYINLRQKKQETKDICYKFNMNLTDNSIFLETNFYESKNRENMDKCLINLFELSFLRLIKKFEIYDAVGKMNFEKKTNDKTFDEDFSSEDEFSVYCENLNKSYSAYLNTFNEYNSNLKNDKDFLSYFSFNQNVLTMRALLLGCSKQNYNELSIYQTSLFGNILKNSKFEDVFKIEKITNKQNKEPNTYLSRSNIVLTFAFFGFIIGVLLVYKLTSFTKINE